MGLPKTRQRFGRQQKHTLPWRREWVGRCCPRKETDSRSQAKVTSHQRRVLCEQLYALLLLGR